MGIFRRLLGREPSEIKDESSIVGGDRPTGEVDGVSYKDLMRQLGSASERKRHDTAMLLSALGHREAIRPIVRAYLTYGDPTLLDALSAFGQKVTMIAAREVRDLSLSTTQRVRLMEVLAVTEDPGAVTLVLPVADDPDPRVHVAACHALACLDDPRGIDRLADDLLKLDDSVRGMALDSLQRLDDPRAGALIEDYVRQYLASGGAVPRRIDVSMPLLVDPEADLADLIGDHARRARQSLVVITGPAVDAVAERRREALQILLADHTVLYATARHSADEQVAILGEARHRAATDPDGRVVLVGRLPSPEGPQRFGHFLARPEEGFYTARIVIVGPLKCALVMEWWRYVDDRAEVPTDLEVVLTNLVLGGGDLTAEEAALYRLAGEERRDEFARAFLAKL